VRAGDFAAVDGVADVDIGVHRALGLEIAQGGEAVVQRDLNTLLGIVFVSALLVIIVNFVVDLIYARLDPRIVAEG